MNRLIATLDRNRPRVHPGARLLAFACVLSPACLAPATEEQAGKDVDVLARELVESARQRVELGQMRVVVRDIRELRSVASGQRNAAQPAHEDVLGKTLEHEFVIALATRVNVVESELVGPLTAQVPASTLSDLASTYGATHLLVGDYRRGDGLLAVSVRLIDADTHVIVAAARGTVTLPELRERQDFARFADSAAPADDAPPPVSAAPRTAEVQLNAPPRTPVAASPPTAGASSPSPPPSTHAAAAVPTSVPSFSEWKAARDLATTDDLSTTEQASEPGTAALTPKIAGFHGPSWYWLHAAGGGRETPPPR